LQNGQSAILNLQSSCPQFRGPINMSPSGFGREEPGPDRQRAGAQSTTPSHAASDPALLESVLQQTLTACSAEAPLDSGTRRALRDVVARHRRKPFSLEPVAVDLVGAVLRGQQQGRPGSSAVWRAVSRRVAQTLCDDPVSRGRLEAFWDRLNEGG
jgi:hypothetical protein